MRFNTAQTVALCVGVVFAIIIFIGLLFLLYASRRARREDREAAAANLGRWKEVGEVDVPAIPKVPVLRDRPSWRGLANPPESLLANMAHTLPSQMIQYDRMVSQGSGQKVENPYSQKETPYREAKAMESQHKDLRGVPRKDKPAKAVWQGEKRERERSRTRKPERRGEREREQSDHDGRKHRDRLRSSRTGGYRSRPAGEGWRDTRRVKDERRSRR